MTKRLIARRVRRQVDASTAFEALFGAASTAFWLDSSDGLGWSYLGDGEQLPVGPGGVLDAPVSYTHLTLPTNREV